MYLQVDEDFPSHPKSVRLCASLQHPVAWAYMIKLWSWARKFQKDGDLTGYEPGEIEFAVGWTLADGKLYAAAVKVGFIDEERAADGQVVKRSIHNWMRRTGGDVVRMEDEASRKKAYRLHKSGRCDKSTCQLCAAEAADADAARLERLADEQEMSDAAVESNTGLSAGRPQDDPDQDKTKQSQSEQGQAKQDPDRKAAEKPNAVGGAPASRTAPPPPAKVLLKLPCLPGKAKGPSEWDLTDREVAVLAKAFPGVDIVAAANRANAWLIANPTRRKTHAGMFEALRRWVARDVDRGNVVPIGSARNGPRSALPPARPLPPAQGDTRP